LSDVALPGLINKGNIDTDIKTQRVVIKNGFFSYCEADASSNKPTLVDVESKIISVESPVRSSDGYPAHSTFLGRDASVGDTVCIRDTTTGTEVFTTIASTPYKEGKGYVEVQVASIGGLTEESTLEVRFCLPYNTVLTGESKAFSISTATGKLNLNPKIAVVIPGFSDISATFEKGDIYVEYREKAYDLVATLGSVGSVSDIVNALGSINADNPLAMALYFALAASNGNIVYFTCVRSDKDTDYVEALDFLEKYNNIYSVTLDTSDSDVVAACGAAVKSVSEDEDSKVRRTLWYAIDTKDELVLAEEDAVVASVSGEEGVNTAIKFVNNVFLSTPFRNGDVIHDPVTEKNYAIVRTNGLNIAYISEVISATSTSSIYTVIRTAPSNDDLVADLIKQRVVSSYKAQCVFGDGAIYNGEYIGNYALAAAAAGMRSGEYCHRPLSNLSYTFFTLAEKHGFTRSQLKQLGANGIWIIGNNTNSVPTNLRQVTSAASGNVNMDEESIIANIDNVALSVANTGSTITGNSNITADLVTTLSIQLATKLSSKCKNVSNNVYIGPQLISYTIDSVYQDKVNLDHIYASFTVEPPKPFNKFSMVMRIV
jgi:hypothetical protein